MEFERKCTSAWQNAEKASHLNIIFNIFLPSATSQKQNYCVKIAVSAKYKPNQKPKGEALQTP